MPSASRRHVDMGGAESALVDWLAEADLQQSLGLALIAGSTDAIVSKTLAGIVTTWNPAAERMFGYKAAEMIGQPISCVIPPERCAEEAVILAKIAQGGPAETFRTVRRRENGDEFPVSVTISPIKDSQGVIIGALNIARDITEAVAADAALKRTHERFELVMRAQKAGEWDWNIPTNEVIWHTRLRHILGETDPDHPASVDDFISRVHPEDREALLANADAHIQGNGAYDIEFRLRKRDGRYMWVHCTGQAVWDQDGQPLHASGSIVDITERKLAEEKFRLVVDGAPYGMVITGQDGKIVLANRQTEALFGYPKAALVGQPVEMLLPGWLRANHPGLSQSSAGNADSPSRGPQRAAMQRELRGRRAHGGEFPVEITLIPLESVEESFVLATVVDVTTAKAAEAQARQFYKLLERQVAERTAELAAARETLSATDAHNSALLASTTLLVISADTSGTVTSFNRAAEQALGYTAAEIVRRQTPAIFHDQEEIADRAAALTRELGVQVDPGFDAFVTKAKLTGNDIAEWTMIRKNKTRFPVLLNVTCLRDENGEITGYMGILQDISERKRIEEEHGKLVALVEESADYIGIGGPSGELEYHNRGARRMVGLPDDCDLSAMKVSDLHPPWAYERIEKQAVPALFATGFWSGENALLHRDGHEIPVLQNLALHRDEDGNPKFFTTVMRDITERKKLENDLLVLVRKLRETNADLDAFADSASHDLTALLRGIDNAAQSLKEALASHRDGGMREKMSALCSGIQRMEKRLSDMREYSFIDRRQDNETVDIIGGEELVAAIMARLAPPASISVITASDFAAITVTRLPLQNLLLHLIGNAIQHHHKPEGVIELTVEDAGEMYRFGVRDDGPGIAKQFHEQIFKMFKTLQPRGQPAGGGIGLAIVRRHIDKAGGTLTLDSEPGQGSLFRFTWPKPRPFTSRGP